MTRDLLDPATERRVAALLLHYLRDDDAGCAMMLADASESPDRAAAVINVLAATLVRTLREITADELVKARLTRCAALAALVEASL